MSINPLDMKGAVVLVTGASAGIGRETAILLSQLNARVVISGRNAERLQATLSQLEGEGHLAEPYDLEAAEGIPAWIKGIVTRTGPLGGLVHSAGAHAAMPVQIANPTKIDGILHTNVTSAFMLVKGFRARGCAVAGSGIVLLSSVSAFSGDAGISSYAASKAALQGFARSAARELANDKLRVNCIAPACVESDMLDHLRESVPPEQFEALKRKHLLDFGKPRDVAHAVAFLLAETGRWITGSTLVMDGGYTLQS
jgi:NAD(P)-dependent dehydrogenase (short-subunit alcohol dehydrogenase family)